MTVKELKEALNDMPEDNIVQIFDPYHNKVIEWVEKGSEDVTSEKGYVFINVLDKE